MALWPKPAVFQHCKELIFLILVKNEPVSFAFVPSLFAFSLSCPRAFQFSSLHDIAEIGAGMKSQNEQQASLIQNSWEGAAFTIIGIHD